LIGVYLVFGPRGSVEASDFSWDGIKNNLSENINLGLDLKGGSQLVMRVKTDDYLKRLTENNREAALAAAKEAQLPAGDASSIAENNNYQVTINATDTSKTQEIIEAVKKKVDFSGWTESVNGNAISWSLPVAAQKVLKDQAVTQAERIIESRINAFGVKEPTFARHGATDSGQLLLQMPGVDDPERVKKLINSESRLELMKVDESTQEFPTKEAALQSFSGTVPSNRRVFPVNERDESTENNTDPNRQPTRWVVLESPAIIDGSEMRDASAFSESGGDSDYKITFSLKPGGAQKFGEWTGRNIGKSMAVVLNDEVKSVASIRGQIFDSASGGKINIRNAKFAVDIEPLDKNCSCSVCHRYSRAYIRHLYQAKIC
jgi:preprotein translocase subunit SecD